MSPSSHTNSHPSWLSDADLADLESRGIAPVTVASQLKTFRAGTKPARLVRPCTVGDGVQTLDVARVEELCQLQGEAREQGRIEHFVPASGAATRMFRELLAPGAADSKSGIKFASELDRFAFAPDVRKLSTGDDVSAILRAAFSDPLSLATLPKGLIPFHRYGDSTRTACAEHLVEASRFAKDASGRVRVHFTVSKEHRGMFAETARRAAKEIDGDFDVSFSEQHPSTDTLAVDTACNPVRDENGALMFRPGGHGALLRNLDELKGDIVAIKNIDNVRREDAFAEPSLRPALVGLAVHLRQTISQVLSGLGEGKVEDAKPSKLSELSELSELSKLFKMLGIGPVESFNGDPQKVTSALDRPLRVCGVVKNQGEPGGGPFWVAGREGVRAQIVESAQVGSEQKDTFAQGTHFNPVEIICSLRNHHGVSYRLEDYVDADAAFVAQKSHNGKPLLALEHPGLWNGAMAGWNTVFVEIPVSEFNPVKTVFDLLRPAHQPPAFAE